MIIEQLIVSKMATMKTMQLETKCIIERHNVIKMITYEGECWNFCIDIQCKVNI